MQRTNRLIVLTGFAAILFPFTLAAQGPNAGSTPTRPQQVPLSGRGAQQSRSEVTQQSTQGGGSSSVNTVNTNVTVTGAYSGSVPDPSAAHAPITLTLGDAIARGLRFNLGTVNASASLRQVRGQRLAALSTLLPNVNASASETGSKSDLEALGLSAGAIKLPGNFSFPTTVGPFHYYDVRASLDYKVLDFVAIHNYRQSRLAEQASQLSEQDARELVVLGVSAEYLRVLATAALVQSQEAQVRYAQSSFDQAQAQYQAGTRSEVDLHRSQVQLQTEGQRLTSQRADLVKQKRSLLRSIGLPLDIDASLAETLPFTPQLDLALQAALSQGLSQRADLKSAETQLRVAEENVRAAHSERLPSVSVNGYAGVEGINPNKGNGIFSGTAAVQVPIWQGGRIHADEQQAHAAVDQRRAEYQDQRGSVELDIRNAYTDLEVATDQVKVAISNRDLALQTLKQSQDRFAAGVTDSVEVVQSEESLAGAERDYISSLYSHNVAKVSLARAMGSAEKSIPDLLKDTPKTGSGSSTPPQESACSGLPCWQVSEPFALSKGK